MPLPPRYVTILTLAAAAVLATACADGGQSVAGPRQAAPTFAVVADGNGGCVSPFIAAAAPAGTAEDVDGDGVVCQFDTAPAGATGPQFAIVDNHTPPQTIGGCPRNFIGPVSSGIVYLPEDRNQDHSYCFLFTPNGTIVYTDNNVRSAP